MEKEDIISSGILELYATGISTRYESMSVEQWTSQYPEVLDELTAIITTIEAYAQSLGIMPSPRTKEKIMRRINTGITAKIIPLDAAIQPIKPLKAVPVFWRTLAAAATFILLASLVVNLVVYNKYQSIASNMVALRSSLQTLQQHNQLAEADMDVVQNKYSIPVALKGLDAAPAAAAKIFWIQNTGDVFVDPTNLPATPAGKQYQLWGFVDGVPVDGGMIITSKKGGKYHIQKMKAFGKVTAFAISLEPEKGNPTPQGPIFVMGKI